MYDVNVLLQYVDALYRSAPALNPTFCQDRGKWLWPPSLGCLVWVRSKIKTPGVCLLKRAILITKNQIDARIQSANLGFVQLEPSHKVVDLGRVERIGIKLVRIREYCRQTPNRLDGKKTRDE